jgi:hypothetical protein
MYVSTKQLEILKVIVAGEGKTEDGKLIPIDMNGLLDRLSYRTTKDSMQFSIRHMIAKGLLEKGGLELRRGRKRVVYLPTEVALKVMGENENHSHCAQHGSAPDEGQKNSGKAEAEVGSIYKSTYKVEDLSTDLDSVYSEILSAL